MDTIVFLQFLADLQKYALTEIHFFLVDFGPVRHKRVDQAVGGRSSQAIGLLDQQHRHPFARGGDGGRHSGKPAAGYDDVIKIGWIHVKNSLRMFQRLLDDAYQYSSP